MKQLLTICCIGFIFSCNSHDRYHQDILDDLAGTYRIDSVVYITNSGQDSVLTDAGIFTFNACDVDDNFSSKICSGSYEDTFGNVTRIKYQLVSDDRITITPQDHPASFNLRSSTNAFQLNNHKVHIEFYPRESYANMASFKEPQRIILSQ